MCGRYTLRTPAKQIADTFGVLFNFDLPARYNIAPSQPVAAIRMDAVTRTRELAMLKWGLVPDWADDPSMGNRLINARAETVTTKPAFRQAFAYRRCLVPADGFFEWRKHGDSKEPMYICMRDERAFGFA